MTVLTWLLIAAVLGLVHLLLAAQVAQRQRTLAWGLGPRDMPMEAKGVAARLERAYRNFLETFPLFAAAALVATIEHRPMALPSGARASMSSPASSIFRSMRPAFRWHAAPCGRWRCSASSSSSSPHFDRRP